MTKTDAPDTSDVLDAMPDTVPAPSPEPAPAVAVPGPRPRALGARDATFHPAFVRQLVARLQREGRDVSWILSAGELKADDLERPDRMLPFEPVRRILHAAQFSVARPSLGVELGQETQLALLGCFGYAVSTAPTVAQALQVLQRFAGLRNRAVRVSQVPVAGAMRLQLEPGFDLADVRRFVMERALVSLLQVVRSIAVRPMDGLVLHVPGPAPAWRSAWDALGVAVQFDAPGYALDVPSSAAGLPTVGASAQEFASAWRECEAAERRQRQFLTFTARVSELLEVEGAIDLEAAASRLAMSTRTLIRRLRAEDTTFQELREGYRREQALILLQDRALTVADIAMRLGYVDGSNFSRTFRRWFGATPVEVRLGRVAWPDARAVVLRSAATADDAAATAEAASPSEVAEA